MDTENVSRAIAINTAIACYIEDTQPERERETKCGVKDKMLCPITMCDKVQIELILSYFPEIK